MKRIVILCAALLLVVTTTLASAGDYTVGGLKISQPWSRSPPAGARVAAGFLTVTNTGAEPDVLIGGSAVISATTEVHEMTMVDGVMKMRALKPGIVIKPGETVILQPGGLHLMFMGLKESLAEGKTFKGTLVFEKAGTIEVEYAVESVGARGGRGAGAPATGHGTGHGKH